MPVGRTFGMNTCWFYAHALSILKREKPAKGGLCKSVETYLWQPGRTRRRDAPCAMCREAASVEKVEQTTPQAYSLERSLPAIDLLFYGGRTRSQWWGRERRGDRENEHQWRVFILPESGWHVYSWYKSIELAGRKSISILILTNVYSSTRFRAYEPP